MHSPADARQGAAAGRHPRRPLRLHQRVTCRLHGALLPPGAHSACAACVGACTRHNVHFRLHYIISSTSSPALPTPLTSSHHNPNLRLSLAPQGKFDSSNRTPPFELEALEAALTVAVGRLDAEMSAVTGRVSALLTKLPGDITPVNLEELRRVKQALVELENKSDTLRWGPGLMAGVRGPGCMKKGLELEAAQRTKGPSEEVGSYPLPGGVRPTLVDVGWLFARALCARTGCLFQASLPLSCLAGRCLRS